MILYTVESIYLYFSITHCYALSDCLWRPYPQSLGCVPVDISPEKDYSFYSWNWHRTCVCKYTFFDVLWLLILYMLVNCAAYQFTELSICKICSCFVLLYHCSLEKNLALTNMSNHEHHLRSCPKSGPINIQIVIDSICHICFS